MAVLPTDTKSLRLLLVEDDEVDVMNVKRALKRIDVPFAFQQAPDGLEALEYLNNCTELPQIILLDINMPRMDGLEFLHALRSSPNLKGITVFVITTSDSPDDLRVAYAHNVAGYILKPLSSEKFSNAIERLVGLWRICEYL